MMRLIRRDGEFPPAGYVFQDPRTGFNFDGLEAGGFNDQVRRILAHRQANAKLYTNGAAFDFEAVAMELEAYQCLRLGNNPKYCRDTESRNVVQVATVGAPVCPVCKGPMAERYCPGCTGKKMIGWRCEKCNTEFNG